MVQAVNEPDEPGGVVPARWRWSSREPRRLAWLSAAVLFTGTIVFAINLVDSFVEGLGPVEEDRLVWSPDMVGCALFLVSGHLAMVGIANWGTLTGALCFAVAGAMQEFEHPAGPRRRRA